MARPAVCAAAGRLHITSVVKSGRRSQERPFVEMGPGITNRAWRRAAGEHDRHGRNRHRSELETWSKAGRVYRDTLQPA